MKKPKNPLRAIVKKCMECSGNSLTEVHDCDLENCPLYPYRLGVDPNEPRDDTDDTEED